MALTSASTRLAISWEQYKTITGFNNLQQGPDSVALSVSPALTGGSACNIVYFEQRTLAAAGSYVYDFSTGLTDANGTAINLSRIFAVAVSSTSGITLYEPDATNGLEWFLSGTSPVVTIPAGAGFIFTTPTAQTVDGTNKRIKLSSTAGSTYKIAFLGGQ
jgi:hypothetical protein